MTRNKITGGVERLLAEAQAELDRIDAQIEAATAERKKILAGIAGFGGAPRRPFVGAGAAKAAKSAPKQAARKAPAERPSDGMTMIGTVLAVLRAAPKPIPTAELVKTVQAAHPGTKPDSVMVAIKRLRKRLLIQSEGPRGRKVYRATPAGRPPANDRPQNQLRGGARDAVARS
jgi:hypothetical protein